MGNRNSFTCPNCKENAVGLLGLLNIVYLMFSVTKCKNCKVQLIAATGTRRLLITCALMGMLVNGVFSSILSSYSIIVFFIILLLPIIYKRPFFQEVLQENETGPNKKR